jgi:hypothetical protein
MKEENFIFFQVEKKYHLLALPAVIVAFIVISIYLLKEKNLIFPITIFTLLPASLYGNFWAKKIIKIEQQSNIFPKSSIFLAPIFVFFYLVLISFALSLLINKHISFIQHIYIILEVICIFYIFYSISILIILMKKTKIK